MGILAGNKPVNAIRGLFGDGKRAIDEFTDKAAYGLMDKVLNSNYINTKYGKQAAIELGENIMNHNLAVGRAIVGGGALAVGGTGLAAGYGTYKAIKD